MLNIPDLEKRWLQYKIRSSAKYFIIPFSIIIVILIAYSLFDTNTKQINEPMNKNIAVEHKPVTKAVEEKVVNVAPIKDNSTKSTTVSNSIPTLSPSMDFINNLENYTPDIEQKPIQKIKYRKKVPKVPKVKKVENVETITAPITEIVQTETVSPQVSKITITKQDTAKDIQNILKRFEKDKNPALSLFLAKKYYELGDYQKASRYALITNKLNKDIEDSWLIFSKSLVKMHKKDKAVKILQKYIANSHSTNASVLLHDILSGEFQ